VRTWNTSTIAARLRRSTTFALLVLHRLAA
jgi:hypothetical protein